MEQINELNIRVKELEEKISLLETIVESYGALFYSISEANEKQIKFNEKILDGVNNIIRVIKHQ